jgi:hypothetical protein
MHRTFSFSASAAGTTLPYGTRFSCRRKNAIRLFIAVILGAFACASANASVVYDSHVNANFNGGPIVTDGSGVAGQAVQVTAAAGTVVAQALTDLGLNHAYYTSPNGASFAAANSSWLLTFTLSGPGAPGTFVPLTIDYSYDFTLSSPEVYPQGYFASFTFGITGNNTNQGVQFDVFSNKVVSAGPGSDLEYCPTKSATPVTGQCLGFYSGSGSVTQSQNWFIGSGNHLGATINGNGDLSTGAGYSTGRILSVIVPDGVTWDYGPGVTGNPLNFQNAGSTAGTPEPGTWGLMAAGLAGVLLRLKRTRTQ